jgi:hypothetical protein
MTVKLRKITKSRACDTEPTEAWAEISEDIPPSIWDVSYYRENLRQDLRHIRVKIIPVGIKPRAAPRRTAQ